MQHRIAFIDFETRSACDLKNRGADVYASHPTTEILCLAWAYDDEATVRISTECSVREIQALDFFVAAGGKVVGHNVAGFEYYIWNRKYNPMGPGPLLKLDQLEDTMAMAFAASLPGSLENAAAAAGITHAKDMKGHRVMMQLSQPREIINYPWGEQELVWWEKKDYPEKFEQLYAYCKQDVLVERELYHRLPKLSPSEQKIWQIDFEINQRGIGVDTIAAENARKLIGQEKSRLDSEMVALTKNAVASTTAHLQLAKWVKEQGVDCEGMAKDNITELLSRGDALPPVVRQALLLRQEAAKSSTAKLESMMARVGHGSRIRNTMQFHGSGTGRWAGRGIQVHNFPRPTIKQVDIEAILSYLALPDLTLERRRELIAETYGAPTTAIANCLRGFLCAAPGKVLIGADWSNIEGRKLAWLAGEEWKLDAFRGFDAGILPDIYVQTYAASFGVDLVSVDDSMRQVGKVQELALGYQGGVGAINTMAKPSGRMFTEEQAEEMKNAWRQRHPKIVQFWSSLESAAIEAVLRPGQKITVSNKISYLKNGSFLWCQLPSKRVIAYPYPEIRQFETPWGQMKDGLTYMGEDPYTKKWERQKSYGGHLAENVTQASSACLLREALENLKIAGLDVVMHVHDEIVCEVLEAEGESSLKRLVEIMEVVPPWAYDLPLAAKGWVGKRYRKG